MGKEDIGVNGCLSDEKRFADLFNVLLFQGEEILLPEKVHQVKGESGLLLEDKDGVSGSVKRFRDIMMQAESGEKLLLLAAENQQEIHYAMPVRVMLYDALNYTEQVKDRAKENKEKKVLNGSAEYLSGLTKQDRLKPVVTVVLYYGDKVWDGCIDLHGLLDMGVFMNEGAKEYLPNYHINLVDVRELAEMGRYRTDLKWIFGLLKFKDDREKMREYVKKHKGYFDKVDKDTFEAIKVMMGASGILNAPVYEGGRMNMCKALEDLYQEGKDEGRLEGRLEGMVESKVEAILEFLNDLGDVPDSLDEQIRSQKDLTTLGKWLKTAARARSIEEFMVGISGE